MAQYRKKPVVISAWPVDALLEQYTRQLLPSPVEQAHQTGKIHLGSEHLLVETLEGTMRADHNDMLVQGVDGELYPCKKSIFLKTYEAI